MGQNWWKFGGTGEGLASGAKRADLEPINHFEFIRSNFGEFSTNLSAKVSFDLMKITNVIGATFRFAVNLDHRSLKAIADDFISPTKTIDDFRLEAQRRTGAICARTIVMVVTIS